MAEDKKMNTGVADVQKDENEQRRDTYGPDHGSGSPYLEPGELQKIWRGDMRARPKK